MPLKWFSLQSTTITPVSFIVSYRAATSLNSFDMSPQFRSNAASSVSGLHGESFSEAPSLGGSTDRKEEGDTDPSSSASTSTFFSTTTGPSVSATPRTESIDRRCRRASTPPPWESPNVVARTQTRRSEAHQTVYIVAPPARCHLRLSAPLRVGEKTADLIRSGPRPTAGSPSSEEPFASAAANNCGGRNLLEPTSATTSSARPAAFFRTSPHRSTPGEKRTAKQTVKSGASQAESDSLVPIGQTLMTSALFFKIGQ